MLVAFVALNLSFVSSHMHRSKHGRPEVDRALEEETMGEETNDDIGLDDFVGHKHHKGSAHPLHHGKGRKWGHHAHKHASKMHHRDEENWNKKASQKEESSEEVEVKKAVVEAVHPAIEMTHSADALSDKHPVVETEAHADKPETEVHADEKHPVSKTEAHVRKHPVAKTGAIRKNPAKIGAHVRKHPDAKTKDYVRKQPAVTETAQPYSENTELTA